MKTLFAGIAAVCISCQLALQVCAQPTTAFAQPLTQTEQARLLGLMTSKDELPPLVLNNSADYHIAKAKSLTREMEQLKPDGTRSGNPLFKKVQFHLQRARLAGVSYESALNEIYRGSSTAPALVQLRKKNWLNVIKSDQELGLLTPENLHQFEQSYAPTVTKGNPKYIGETAEVDHAVPIGGPNGRPIYENEVANLRMLPKSLNREKSANVNNISQGREEKLDRAYWADKNTIAGGMIGSGFGLLLIYTSGSTLLADLNTPHDDLTGKLRIGENASVFVSGGAMTAVGISEIGSRFVTSDKALSIFSGVTKWGGRTTLAGIIIAEPIALGLDYENWGKMTTGQRIDSVVQHGVNIGSGGYQAYRIYRASRAAETLIAGSELAGEEDVAGGGPEDPVGDAIAGATLVATVFMAGGQWAYDLFHPIPPSWNSSAFSGLSPDHKRQVEDSIYHNYGVAR